MMKDFVIYMCKECGFEKTVSFYDASEATYSCGDDIIPYNVEQERAILKRQCPKCHKYGFERKKNIDR